MKTEEHEDCQLTYDDSPEAHKRIYDMMLKWFKEMGRFSGDSIHQSDECDIQAPYILTDVAEEGFRFETTYPE